MREFSEVDGIWLPTDWKQIKFNPVAKEIYRLEERSFSYAETNQSLEKSEFSISSLPMKEKFNLVDSRTGRAQTQRVDNTRK